MAYKLTQIRCNLGIDTISRKSQCAEVMVSVAPASRRLPAFSRNPNTAGKMPALPRHAAASFRQDPSPLAINSNRLELLSASLPLLAIFAADGISK